MIVVGSCRLSRFDPALVAYTFASLFAVFGITGHYAVRLQRPLTARFWKRGWPVFFRRGHRGRNLGLWGKRVTGEGVPHTSDPVIQAVYQPFISYSHAADDQLSPVIQSALQRFAKAWYQLRAMRVFRGQTGLSANPALWG
jgi:hypothetical protein